MQSFNAIRDIFYLPKKDIEKILSPRFYTYFHTIFKKPETFTKVLETKKYIFAITNSKDKVVLDFGCGMGFDCIIFSLLGAKKVIGLDDNEEYILTFKKLIEFLKLDVENIEPVFSQNGLVHFKDKSINTIIMQEVASHVSGDVFNTILNDIHRVLQTEGCIFMKDENNKLQLPFLSEKRQRKRLRYIAENGPVSGRPQLGIKEPYKVTREKIIRQHFPLLTEKEITDCVQKTQGMKRQEILYSVTQYIKNETIQTKPAYKYTDPISGHLFEMEINPFKLQSLLRKKGFTSHLLPPNLAIVIKRSDPLFKRILKKIIQKTIKHPRVFFYPLLLFFDKDIRILAKKQDTLNHEKT